MLAFHLSNVILSHVHDLFHHQILEIVDQYLLLQAILSMRVEVLSLSEEKLVCLHFVL